MITQQGKKEQLETAILKVGPKASVFKTTYAAGVFNVPLVPLFSRVQTFFDQII
jgi:hypothetical protein